MSPAAVAGEWLLERADSAVIDTLMGWFRVRQDVIVWGGPKFRFPFTPESFRADCHWPQMASYALSDPDRRLAAFGQFYERDGRINLARLVVEPRRRRQGVGRRLITMLMSAGARALPLEEFSLFVYRNNLAALRCYRSLGFEVREYPADEVLADECFYLTRPVGDLRKGALPATQHT